MKRIAIVGGGISGLSAAWRLHTERQRGAELECVLYEASSRLGGVLVTERVDDCLVEAGPDSFLSEKSWSLDFCRELGLGDQLIGSNDAERKTYILVNNRLVPIPDGLQFMVPTRILPILFTPLFSWGAKLHMVQEYFYRPPNGAAGRDPSVAEMVERHFGPEMVERLADPLLAGVYGGDAASLSAAAVLPRFVDMEKRYGSLSRAMLAARKQRAEAAKQNGQQPPAPRPLFTSLRGGMQQLVDAIVPRLGTMARTNAPVAGVLRRSQAWQVVPQHGPAEDFDSVILAVPAYAAAAMLQTCSPPLAEELAEIPYSSSLTVALGYNRSDLAAMPPGFGFLVPRSEGRRIMALTFVHTKFPHRAPPDRAIIRVFLGGSRDPEALSLEDEEILAIVQQELADILGLRATPRFARLYRWDRAMAQYASGHLRRMERLDQLKRSLPGLELAGNAYRGIGVPDCIASGLSAADRVLSGLAKAQLDSTPRPR